MSKIVCDICGTSYDDSMGACPVCGWNPGGDLDVDAASDMDMDEVLSLNFQEEEKPAAPVAPAAAAAAAATGKAALDVKAVQNRRRPAAKPVKAEKPAEDEDDEDDEEDSCSNGFLVFILILLILALLAVSAYIGWTKIIKPRMGSDDNKPQETISATIDDTVPATTDVAPIIAETVTVPVEETTEPGIPCTNLSLVGGMDTLTFKGQYWRLMVKAEPDNTTEKVIYTSGDESVVTIDEYGRVTAVGEGETVIIVTCGSKRIETPAVVSFATEATEATTAAGGETGTATTTTGTTVSTPTSGAVLKLNKTDVTIGKKGVYITLEPENGISASDVKWSTTDSSVATVWGGNVTAIGRGTCVVIAEYNGQKAQCVIRVKY